ncbi:hypothetical protein SAMN04488028_1011031 [Reichenbachiella agariperforans]|uniref:Uncharacterized protein n=1 Tax=Reichenbachiella agariperforans TaxID=156994 RepID=A0A1M6LNA5_REIAG|nr:hypothetical protein [Reichenbachiella agariperforans]SHJ72623.1 hypothetical protein SAMN04488028_1011031 [Reichenbachiella agariperforans]
MIKFLKPALLIIFLISAQLVQAQKIKYKDLFPMLEAKSYDTAIPMLKTYLSDSKNADDANANLQMALYYEQLVGNYHLVEDSTAIMESADSALVYLLKAQVLVDDKELRKNDDYYQAYYRRDLRSGEFGIKLSDVQLDIENKIKAMKSIVDHAGQIYASLFAMNRDYTFCYDAYTGFVKKHETEAKFYLMSQQEQLETLQKMMDYTLDIREKFNDLRTIVSLTGVKGYSPELEFRRIREFGTDGMEEIDFFANDVRAWDYGAWAELAYSKIERDVLPMKEGLVAFDKKLKAEYESMDGLATVKFEELTLEIDPKLLKEMKELEDEPLPETLFEIQIKLNTYDFITKPMQNPRIEDMEDVDYQVTITDSLLSIIDNIEANAKTLVEPFITEGTNKYPALVEGEYGGDFGLIKLRQKMEGFVDKSRSKWEEKNEEALKRSQWAVSTDGADSIYLVTNSDGEAPRYLSDYYSIATHRDDSANIFVIGLEMKGSESKGFFAKVNKSRTIEWKNTFSLSKFKVDKTNLLVFGEFFKSQEGSVSAYVFSLAESGQNNMIAVSYDMAGKNNWINPINAPKKPVSIKMNDIVKETIIYFVTEEELETYAGSDSPYVVIDRLGNVR